MIMCFTAICTSVNEITKLEKTSLSDFTLCEAELLPKLLKQLEESPQRFLQTCTDSLIVCADCVGMSGSENKSCCSTNALQNEKGSL